MDIKTIIAIISVGISIFGYSFYFKDIFAGKTKPHAFSWLIWGILTAIAFFGQISDNAGAGAWITLVTAITCFIVFGLSLTKGEKNITTSDKIYLTASLLSLVPWLLTNDPLISVILVTIIDFFGFLPTIRKSITKPHEETLIHYFFAGLKFVLAMFALDNISIITALYPLYLVIASWGFIILLVVQRRKVKLLDKDT